MAKATLLLLAAVRAATRRPGGPPACSGLPSGPEKERPPRVDAKERLRWRSAAWPKSPIPPPLSTQACAACGDVLGVPVQRLREDDAIGTLDLTGHSIGVLGARLLAFLLPAASSVCNLCVRCNELGPEGAATLAEQLRASPALTSLDLAQNYLGVQGGTALAEGLKGSAVTSLNLAFNGIGAEGVTKLAAVLGQTEIAHLNLMGSSLCGVNQYGRGTYTCEGITKLCAGLKGSAVTLLNVRENSLEGSAKVAIRMVFKDLPIELLI